jgi:hypothetical protein
MVKVGHAGRPRLLGWVGAPGAGPCAFAAAVLCATLAACVRRDSKFVSPEDAAYCPCSGAPTCPVDAGGASCLLQDVERSGPYGRPLKRQCGAFDVVSIIASSTDYIGEANSGKVIASVEFVGEGYLRTPGGWAPDCRCGGPEDLRVGPLVSQEMDCRRAVVKGLVWDGV